MLKIGRIKKRKSRKVFNTPHVVNIISGKNATKPLPKSRMLVPILYGVIIVTLVGASTVIYIYRDRISNLSIPAIQGTNGALAVPVTNGNSKSEFEQLLKEGNFNIEKREYHDDDNYMIVQLVNGVVVIFSLSEDAKMQISSLQSILNRLTIDNRRPKTIDFRYSKPVVRF